MGTSKRKNMPRSINPQHTVESIKSLLPQLIIFQLVCIKYTFFLSCLHGTLVADSISILHVLHRKLVQKQKSVTT